MIGAFLLFLVFLCLLIIAGLRSYRKIPAELVKIADVAGITLRRSWARRGGTRHDSPFLYGPAFAGTYRDMDVTVSTVINDQGNVLGTSLTFSFLHALSLSLFFPGNVTPFVAKDIRDEYRDIYLQRVDPGIELLKAWAKDKNKAGLLLRGGDVHERLARLVDCIQEINRSTAAELTGLPQAGFVINDQEVTLMVTTPRLLTRDVINVTYDLAQVLSGAGFGPPVKFTFFERRGITFLAMLFAVLFVLFVLGVMMAEIFGVEIAPFLTRPGLR